MDGGRYISSGGLSAKRKCGLSISVGQGSAVLVLTSTTLDTGAKPKLVQKRKNGLARQSNIRPVRNLRHLNASRRLMKLYGLIYFIVYTGEL